MYTDISAADFSVGKPRIYKWKLPMFILFSLKLILIHYQQWCGGSAIQFPANTEEAHTECGLCGCARQHCSQPHCNWPSPHLQPYLLTD